MPRSWTRQPLLRESNRTITCSMVPLSSPSRLVAALRPRLGVAGGLDGSNEPRDGSYVMVRDYGPSDEVSAGNVA